MNTECSDYISSDDSTEVVILGAGFSHVLNCQLPLSNRLGQLALARAKKSAPDLFKSSPQFSDEYPFEVWLSLFSEDQPYLDESLNRLNEALFVKLKEAIVAELRDVPTLALKDPLPFWFSQLLTLLHRRRAVVITLNYDTLIEAGVNSMYLDKRGLPDELLSPYANMADSEKIVMMSDIHPATQKGITSDNILGQQPPTLASPSYRSIQSFRLLKLHGSIDWWSVPKDESGATLVREPARDRFGKPNQGDLQPLLGREPFIVPPLTSKSAYFRNPILRQIWKDAYWALAKATRISIVGYSLPQADIVMAGMLEAAIAQSKIVIEVVNTNPNGVKQRLDAFRLPKAPKIDIVESIPEWVDRSCQRASSKLPQQISMLCPSTRPQVPDFVYVVGSRDGSSLYAPVTKAEIDSNGVLTVTADFEGRNGVMDTHEIIKKAKYAKSVVLADHNKRRVPIIAFEVLDPENPHTFHNLCLVIAGQV